jgi:hypothetical protein
MASPNGLAFIQVRYLAGSLPALGGAESGLWGVNAFSRNLELSAAGGGEQAGDGG